jgi:hypothetical protein
VWHAIIINQLTKKLVSTCIPNQHMYFYLTANLSKTCQTVKRSRRNW